MSETGNLGMQAICYSDHQDEAVFAVLYHIVGSKLTGSFDDETHGIAPEVCPIFLLVE